MGGPALMDAMERQTICFPLHGTQDVLQKGDPGFKDEINQLYCPAENNSLEDLVNLKAHLQTLSTDDFWSGVTEGMSKILGADMSFVFKRVLVDYPEAPVEMPPYGEPGSCVMAAAFYYCNKNGSKDTIKQTKFHAYGCPCAYMRHDKVFLIPENLKNFIKNNPNQLPTPAEAYIAVPLFSDGKCFAHFGAMWSEEAAAQRKLSWAFIEVLLRSLEDMILQRFLQGSNFMRPLPAPEKLQIIPHDIVTVAQSLRPYAGSLSHELRTPMQGIVGMLDVMYATVEEAVQTQADPKLRKIFEDLKDNIEVVQDSSRRAVEAADNVVHAYDMDMSVPDPPPYSLLDDTDSASPFTAYPSERRPEIRPEIFVAGSNLPLSRKRRREEAFPSSRHGSNASNSKFQKLEGASPAWSADPKPTIEIRAGLNEAEAVHSRAQEGATAADAPTEEDAELAAGLHSNGDRLIAPGQRYTKMRDVFKYVIKEGLKMGGRPDSALAQETTYGETIEVRSRGSDGMAKSKTIEWSVDPDLPSTVSNDEKDLTKLISCVFLNAIKFTDQHDGRVGVYARMSSRGRYISIRIADNGPGIPAAFIPKLFKPFSRENDSITRRSEGLGLGLMVAKGIARKLGGDLMCTRAETEGPNHGTEFEIRVPVSAGETLTRPPSPCGSPEPRRASVAPTDLQKSPLARSQLSPGSPPKVSGVLHEAINDTPPTGSHRLSTKSHGHHTSHTMGVETSITSPPPTPPNGLVASSARPRLRKSASVSNPEIDRDLANKYPLSFLVAEDNKINRKLLVSMLNKFGYKRICEAHDGAEAVRQMKDMTEKGEGIDIVLMDLWMPLMDGYEATERILGVKETPERPNKVHNVEKKPTVLAVTADATDGAQERAARVGMKGFMTKPYKIYDLQRLITESYAYRSAEVKSTPKLATA